MFSKERRKILQLIPAAVLSAPILGGVTYELLRSNNSQEKNNPKITENIISEDSLMVKEPLLVTESISNSRLEAIVKTFPRSEQYLDIIVSAYEENIERGTVPIEYIIGLIQQESAFNPHAVSSAFAMGLMQIIRPTASHDLRMRTYTDTDFPELRALEKATQNLLERVGNTRRAYQANLRRNEFNELRTNKLLNDRLFADWNSLYREYRELYKDTIAGTNLSEKDDRLIPEKAIPAGIRYLSRGFREFTRIYGGEPVHNSIRALAAYNAGLGTAVQWYGLPVIQETVDYTRKIMINVDKIKNNNIKLIAIKNNKR